MHAKSGANTNIDNTETDIYDTDMDTTLQYTTRNTPLRSPHITNNSITCAHAREAWLIVSPTRALGDKPK